ncbi:Hypothetical protein LUCI_2146 [Lucifera butyrica]|uniref:Uncharacterized protein n=1 Tax=Lucifera butyrica TaxID=1351585 RepID=A0A498R2P8_9FIRM|nr:hypothetical protein [Lucifera butyrica]VBB06906.1 Hypothetical protein LUCI_2146 [Lucifera butyrica]
MPKTVALSRHTYSLSRHLRDAGYQVIDDDHLPAAGRHPDVYLYSGHHPDLNADMTAGETADISLGSTGEDNTDYPAAISLNITGLKPAEVVSRLNHIIRPKNWH